MELAIGEMKIGTIKVGSSPASSAICTERQKTEGRLQELQAELVHISRLTAMGRDGVHAGA